jgi:hypothetical protein
MTDSGSRWSKGSVVVPSEIYLLDKGQGREGSTELRRLHFLLIFGLDLDLLLDSKREKN